jgi:peptidyl-prolyl cis-trans isomerase C
MKRHYSFSAGRMRRGKPEATGLILKAIVMMGMLVFSSLPGPARADADGSPLQHETAIKNAADAPKEVVARVNGIEITRAEVDEKTAQMRAARIHDGAEDEMDPAALRNVALDKLILQELAYERAKSRGITVSGRELDDAIAEIKASVGGEEKYREGLKKRQMTEDELRGKLERNLMVKHIFEKEVSGEIVVTEEEMRKEYERVKDEFSMPEKVVIDDIVLFLPLEDENSMKIAGDFLRKIQDDPERNPWNIPTDGSFAVREREITKAKQGELYAEARKLKEGEISGVIRTSDSFHIILLKKYTPAVEVTFEQLRDRIERRLHALAQQKKLEEWESELKKGAAIEILGGGEEER